MQTAVATPPVAYTGPYVNVGSKMEVRGFKEIYIVPDWIYNYVAKKTIIGEHLLEKCIVDERLSIDDLASIFFLNNKFSCNSEKNAYPKILNQDNMYECFTLVDVLGQEYKSKVENARNWAYSDRIEQEVMSRLSAVCSETSSTYDFVVSGPKIWLIIKPGFLHTLQNSSKRLDFYRDFIKVIAKIAPTKDVLNTTVFSNYVEDLIG